MNVKTRKSPKKELLIKNKKEILQKASEGYLASEIAIKFKVSKNFMAQFIKMHGKKYVHFYNKGYKNRPFEYIDILSQNDIFNIKI
jgi:hypothetical protein